MPERTVPAAIRRLRRADSSLTLIRSPRLQRQLARLNQLGVGLGVVAFFLSLTPSLLPRPWPLQGVVSGLAAVSAYASGVVLSRLGRWAGVRPTSPRARRWVWYGIAILTAVLAPLTVWLSSGWQDEVRRSVNMPAEGAIYTSGCSSSLRPWKPLSSAWPA